MVVATSIGHGYTVCEDMLGVHNYVQNSNGSWPIDTSFANELLRLLLWLCMGQERHQRQSATFDGCLRKSPAFNAFYVLLWP